MKNGLSSEYYSIPGKDCFLYRRRAEVRACPGPWQLITIPECVPVIVEKENGYTGYLNRV